MKPDVYLILDPYHDYAAAMMRYCFDQHGLKALCLITSRRYEIFAKQYVAIDPRHVEARYHLEDQSDDVLLAKIMSKYNPIAFIPHDEPYLMRAMDFLERMPVRWNDPALIRLFRNKQALKQHLKRKDPGLPLNHTRHVSSAAEAIALRPEFPGSVVLKPNDGMGTLSVGLIHAPDWEGQIKAYFDASQCTSVIMEEFIEAAEPGVEYAVNGQIDDRGAIVYQSIISYYKVSANGRSFLYYQDHHVPYASDKFRLLTDYATRVMQASGLRRCPFHMELVLSQQVPLLVEVAARLLGVSWGKVVNDVHGSGFDVFAMAAHYYLFDRPYDGPGPNWPAYDANHYISVYGIGAQDEFVVSVDGLKDVERLPGFKRWGTKPEVGRRVNRTVDLFTRLYDVQLISTQSMEDLRRTADQVRALIVVNKRMGLANKVWAVVLFAIDQLSWRWRYGSALLGKYLGRLRIPRVSGG